jgi:hypothetical protein
MALALNRDDISVSVADTPVAGPGIDLVVVTDDSRLLPVDHRDECALRAVGI